MTYKKLSKKEIRKLKRKMKNGIPLNKKEAQDLKKHIEKKGGTYQENIYHKKIKYFFIVIDKRKPENIQLNFFQYEGESYVLNTKPGSAVYNEKGEITGYPPFIYRINKDGELEYANKLMIKSVRDVILKKRVRRLNSNRYFEIPLIKEEWERESIGKEYERKLNSLKPYQKAWVSMVDHIIEFDREFRKIREKSIKHLA